MRRKGLLCAGALVVVANAIALFGVARNRATAVQTIELTDRELPLAYQSKENSGVELRLLVAGEFGVFLEPRQWLNASKLRELGFDTNVHSNADFVKIPSRSVYLALEYNGPAWERFVEEWKKKTGAVSEDQLGAESRLVAIDAALSPNVLRARYNGGRYLIVRGTIETMPGSWRDESEITAYTYIVPDEIHVPLPLSNLLKPLENAPEPSPEDPRTKPRYTVRLSYGPRYEPWIESVAITK